MATANIGFEEALWKAADKLRGSMDSAEYKNGNNLNEKIVVDNKTKKVNHKEYLKYKKDLNDRTVLVSINGTLGKVALYNGEKVVLGKSACYFNVNKNTDKHFVKYVMISDIFKQWFVDFEFPNEDGEPYKSSGGEMVESEMGMIPKGWEVRTVEDAASVVSKGTTPTKKDMDAATDGLTIKFLKVKDIDDNGNILTKTIEKIPNSIHLGKLKRSILKKWDILFSIAGTIGRVATINDRFNNSNANQAISFIRLKEIKKCLSL